MSPDATSTGPLASGYDLAIFDLDGVVYLVDEPVPGAPEAIARLRQQGTKVAFATNNAARRPADVAEVLSGMGVPATADSVLTSAAAAAATLAAQYPPGTAVLVVGSEGLRAEVRDAGLRPVRSADERPAAVVQGYGPEVGWRDLAEGCVAVRAGARWVVTNMDPTLPTARGPLPGNGSLVAALATALGRQPDLVVGKPEPALFTTAARRWDAAAPLVVGDRLDTDIEGARRAGMASLLVLTGVSRPADLLAAPPVRRPDYVAIDLGGLFAPADDVRVPSEPSRSADGWRLRLDRRVWSLDGAGSALAALRLLCAHAWVVEPPTLLRAESPAAREALAQLQLAPAPGRDAAWSTGDVGV